MKAWILALQETGKIFTNQRKLWIPFGAAAVLQLFWVALIWLAPHPPFAGLLAPPIRYFFSDRVLHYPWHLWFLYHAMKHTHLLAALIGGAFLSGVACAMVRQAWEKQPLSLRAVLVSGQVRYGTVTLLWGVTWFLGRGLMRGLAAFLPQGPALLWASIGAAVLLQGLLLYAIPAAVFERAGAPQALWRSIQEAARHPVGTLALVAILSGPLFLFAFWFPPARIGVWMMKSAPEIAVLFVGVRLLLWMGIEALLTVATAHLWFLHRSAPQAVPASSDLSLIARPLSAVPRLSVFFLALLLSASSGCSQAYNAERLLWKAQKVAAPIFKDPATAEPMDLERAVRTFEQVIQKVPGSWAAGRAQFAIGALYGIKGQYDRARQSYSLLLQDYSPDLALCLQARWEIAKMYQEQENWNQAIQAYKEIAEYHPWSGLGLASPLIVAGLIHQHQGEPQAVDAYERAIRIYKRLIAQAPSKESELQAKSYLAAAYQGVGQRNETVQILEELEHSSWGKIHPVGS